MLDATATRRPPPVIPGFGLSLGVTLTFLSLIVLIPLAGLFIRPFLDGWDAFANAAFSSRALAAYRLSFGASFLAALVNAGFGLIVAWVLVRYRFPGKAVLNAMVDLPFALPTAVAGIALTAVYAPNGVVGRLLAPLGIELAYNAAGVAVALVFIGLPFIVRTVEPVLADLADDVEEAAATLGASRAQIFARVILPAITPALLTGFALALARGIGEYGSVIFIAGNMPGVSEIAPLLIVTQLEQYDYAGATGIALVMLIASFVILFFINRLQHLTQARAA